jgi:hypothetical protein
LIFVGVSQPGFTVVPFAGAHAKFENCHYFGSARSAGQVSVQPSLLTRDRSDARKLIQFLALWPDWEGALDGGRMASEWPIASVR